MSEGSDGGLTSPNQLWNLGVFLLKVPGLTTLKKGISDPISKSGKSDLMVGKTCNMIFYPTDGIGPQGSITTLV